LVFNRRRKSAKLVCAVCPSSVGARGCVEVIARSGTQRVATADYAAAPV